MLLRHSISFFRSYSWTYFTGAGQLNGNDPNKCAFNAQDNNGNTPLHLLCVRLKKENKQQMLPVIRFISEKGASFSITNTAGKTPDELTNYIALHNFSLEQKQNVPITSIPDFPKGWILYPNKDSSWGQGWNSSSWAQRPQNSTVSNISNIDQTAWKTLLGLRDRDSHGYTLLHFLCAGDRLGALNFLVQNGADVQLPATTSRAGEMDHQGSYKDSTITVSPFQLLFMTSTERTSPERSQGYPSNVFPYANFTTPKFYNCNPAPQSNRLTPKDTLIEAERMAEYLFDHCGNRESMLREMLTYPLCPDSDIVYRLYKKDEAENRAFLE